MFQVKEQLIAADPPFDHSLMMTNLEAATRGEALVLVAGRLTLCPPATVPTHIAVADVAAGTDQICPVKRVRDDLIFITTSAALMAATDIGTKFVLAADALGITGVSVGGVFEVTYADGTNTVRGKFTV